MGAVFLLVKLSTEPVPSNMFLDCFRNLTRKKRVLAPQTAVGMVSMSTAKKNVAISEATDNPNQERGTIVGENGWLVFKEALTTLKGMCSGPLAPLKTTLVGVIAVMDHVEVLCMNSIPETMSNQRDRE
jgi:hypothetical protein